MKEREFHDHTTLAALHNGMVFTQLEFISLTSSGSCLLLWARRSLPQVIGHHLQLQAITIIHRSPDRKCVFGLISMFLAPPTAAFLRNLLELIEHSSSDPE